MPIDVNASYWIVGGHEHEVFSSAKPGWVPETDADYEAWLQQGNIGRPILNDGELCFSLLSRDVPVTTIAACSVTDFGPTLSYDQKLAVIAAIGCNVTSTGTPGLNGTYELSGRPWDDLKDEAQYIQTYSSFSGGETSFAWETREGIVTFNDTGQLLAVVRGLADYLTKWKRYLLTGGTAPTAGSTTIA